MPSSARKLATLCAIASLLMLLSCKKQPPKEPTPEADPFAGAADPTPPPEAPAPKCEALGEGCKAEADTWVEVGDEAKFQPAEGWIYAKMERVSVAKTKDDAAGIAYRMVPAPLSPKQNSTGLIDALKPVFEVLNAEVSEKSIQKEIGKDGVVDDKGSLKLATWQLEGKVGGADGVVIIVVSTLDSGKGLVGAVALKKASVQDNLEAVQKGYRSVRSSQ